jgi:hypothetical protein
VLDFFLAQSNLPYAVALAIVALLGVIEGLTLIAGISLMAAMDDWLPDADLDTDLPQGGLTALAGWLCLDRLPVLIWFVLALGCFSITGYLLNYFSWLLTSALLPQVFSLLLALPLAAVACHFLGGQLARVLPKNESSAVSIEDLSGSVGTVTLGCAIKGNPSEAVVQDQYRQKHYVLVEPEDEDTEFPAGVQVVLLRRSGRVWSATRFEQ